MKDCVGTEFEVGQVITYPGRFSSTMYVNTAVIREVLDGGLVLEVFEVKWQWSGEGSKHGYVLRRYKTTIYRTDRATVTPLTEFELTYRMNMDVHERNEEDARRKAARQ